MSMVSKPRSMRFIWSILLLIFVNQCFGKDTGTRTSSVCSGKSGVSKPKAVHLVVAACGPRLDETMVLLKSAVMFSQVPLRFHIFADDDLRPQFKARLEAWPSWVKAKIKYRLYKMNFPHGDHDKWRKLFKLCASQRVFIPDLLKKVDAALYVDTDILFQRPLEDIWAHFAQFNETQLAALTPEHEPQFASAGWYNRHARHPYYPPLGLNSGVMLMNLTRMRAANWTTVLVDYYQKYKLNIVWGDQDLINIYFHFHPESVFVYPCQWNYRPDHCMYGSNCHAVHTEGISVLHGNRRAFHTESKRDTYHAFMAVYNAFRDYEFGEDMKTQILDVIPQNMDELARGTYCGEISHVFMIMLRKQIKKIQKREKKAAEKTAKKAAKENLVAGVKTENEKSDDNVNQHNKQSEVKTEEEENKEDAVKETAQDVDSESKRRGTLLSSDSRKVINLSVVACGDRFAETMVMLKSATLFTRGFLHFIIFADDDLLSQFEKELSSWPESVRCGFNYTIRPLAFPTDNRADWRKLFKPCASQRLFFPDVLHDIDSLLYVDTDVLFLRPVDDLWAVFDEFNSTHLAMLTPEHEDAHTSWYKRFARHPYYPPLGVNSGVMLMNLTRMRQAKWVSHHVDYYKTYRYNLTWGDQDLINIYFSFYPDQLLVLPCDWNYRPDHCMYMSVCREAESQGASVVHGCRRTFHNEKQPAFKAVYDAIEQYEFGADIQSLVRALQRNLAPIRHTNCGKLERVFSMQLQKQASLLESRM